MTPEIKQYKNGRLVYKRDGVVVDVTNAGSGWPSLKVEVSDKENRYYYHVFYTVHSEGSIEHQQGLAKEHSWVRSSGENTLLVPDVRDIHSGRDIPDELRLQAAEREFERYMKVRGTRTSWGADDAWLRKWKARQGSLLKKADVPADVHQLEAPVSKEHDAVSYVYNDMYRNQITSIPWRDFQKRYQQFAQKYNKLFTEIRHNRPQVTLTDLYDWLEEEKDRPESNYTIDYERYQSAENSFRDVEQLVLQLNQGANAQRILAQDPVIRDYVTMVAQGGQQSEHPVTLQTVGWLRVDFVNEDWLLIDEVQSDLVNSVVQAKNIVITPTFEEFVENLTNPKVREKVLEKVSPDLFYGLQRHFQQKGYTPEKLDEIKNRLVELFEDWAEWGIASVLKIAREHGIKNVAIHTAETISQRDESVEADKVKMYYDNLAKSFGFKKQQINFGDVSGNFWVRTASKSEIDKVVRDWNKAHSIYDKYDTLMEDQRGEYLKQNEEWLKSVYARIAPYILNEPMFADAEFPAMRRELARATKLFEDLKQTKELHAQVYYQQHIQMILDYIISYLKSSQGRHTGAALSTPQDIVKKWLRPDNWNYLVMQGEGSEEKAFKFFVYAHQQLHQFYNEVKPLDANNRSLFNMPFREEFRHELEVLRSVLAGIDREMDSSKAWDIYRREKMFNLLRDGREAKTAALGILRKLYSKSGAKLDPRPLVEQEKIYKRVRTDPRQESIYGPEHAEELKEFHSRPAPPKPRLPKPQPKVIDPNQEALFDEFATPKPMMSALMQDFGEKKAELYTIEDLDEYDSQVAHDLMKLHDEIHLNPVRMGH